MVASARAGGTDFELTVTASPTPAILNSTLTYTINVTNRSGLALTNVLVSDFPPSSVQIVSGDSSSGPLSNIAGVIVLRLPVFTNNQGVRITLNVRPTVLGTLTNVVTVVATNADTATSTLLTDVFVGQSDLGVTITGPGAPVLINDQMTYAITVTNAGPGIAPNVILSNSLPADLKLLSVSPANVAFTLTNSSLIFFLSNAPSSTAAHLAITVQPTNSGSFLFAATVSSVGVLETNTANNSASTNITVNPFLTGQLIATIISTQRYNPQTGLMEQRIRVTNAGTNDVASARVIVSGLSNRLFNAVGTNDGRPFVLHAAPLAISQSVDLLLEYFVSTRQPIPMSDTNLIAVEVPAVSLTATVSTNIPRRIALVNGAILIEFPATPGLSYSVVYSDDSFTNTLAAQPAIIAPADRVQWIDDGPPKTISHPSVTPTRMYRVQLNASP